MRKFLISYEFTVGEAQKLRVGCILEEAETNNTALFNAREAVKQTHHLAARSDIAILSCIELEPETEKRVTLNETIDNSKVEKKIVQAEVMFMDATNKPKVVEKAVKKTSAKQKTKHSNDVLFEDADEEENVPGID